MYMRIYCICDYTYIVSDCVVYEAGPGMPYMIIIYIYVYVRIFPCVCSTLYSMCVVYAILALHLSICVCFRWSTLTSKLS